MEPNMVNFVSYTAVYTSGVLLGLCSVILLETVLKKHHDRS